jgi:GntR family transcriptional repressor for pyruvate dehydrogenase complex
LARLRQVSRPQPVKEDVTVRLLSSFKRLLSEGTLVAGTRLPAERDLAESFQVSRSSLRQALKVLEIMGVISQRVGDGTYVNAAAPQLLGEPMEFLILLDGISFHELMEARIIVEPELAARAASRATDDDLATLRRETMAMKEFAGNHTKVSEHDIRFHQAIFNAAGNRVCSMMFTVIHQALHNLMDLTSRLVPVEHTLLLHQRIYAAIKKGDADEARRRMTEHLLDAKGLLARAHEQRQDDDLQVRITELAKPSLRARTRRAKS